MQAMALAVATPTEEDRYIEVNMDSSEMCACIQWLEHHEDFKVVSLDDLTDIRECIGVANTNLNAISDDISWDNEAAHIALAYADWEA